MAEYLRLRFCVARDSVLLLRRVYNGDRAQGVGRGAGRDLDHNCGIRGWRPAFGGPRIASECGQTAPTLA